MSTNPDLQEITHRPKSVVAPASPIFFQKWAQGSRRPIHPYAKFVAVFLSILGIGIAGLWYQSKLSSRTKTAVRIEAVTPQQARPRRVVSKTSTPAAIKPAPVKAAQSKPRSNRRTSVRRKRAKKAAAGKPAVEVGRLYIEAWTTGGRQIRAKIQIDGRDVPKSTPVSLKARIGERKITITAPGYAPISQTAVVRANKQSKVQVIVDL